MGTLTDTDMDTDSAATKSGSAQATPARGSNGATAARITLGVITLITWFGNVRDDFYDGENFVEFFNWVFSEEEGNGSSLTFVRDILDATILQAPEFFGWVLTFFELAIALGLIFGVATRAVSLAAIAFFANLFLVYFGGEEWIYTYVLLVAMAVISFFDWGGRRLGVDQVIAKTRGESPFGLIW